MKEEPQTRPPVRRSALTATPIAPAGIAEWREGDYALRFARTAADLERVQRLRYEVFHLELGEGLDECRELGIDRDRFDATCHHLMLEEGRSGEVVGTYRLQTLDQARTPAGFYCDGEFVLETLPAELIASSVELGRACIRKDHRQSLALFALWRGLAAYLLWSRRRYFFGCCSLTSQDPLEGLAMHGWLQRNGHMHDRFKVPVRADHACLAPPVRRLPSVKVPPLFRAYLRHGAQACSPPALDRDFGTIDFLVLFDVERIPPRLRRFFFQGLETPSRS